MKKAFKVFCILILCGGCSKSPQGKSFSDLKNDQTVYTSSTRDRKITSQDLEAFSLENTLGISDASAGQKEWLTTSSDIFRLAEASFLLGLDDNAVHIENKNDHLKFGHALLDLFYSNKKNTTQFTSQTSMYLPAALGFEGEKIYEKFKVVAQQSDSSKLAKVFSNKCLGNQNPSTCLSLDLPHTTPTLQPKFFLVSIINYLNKTIEFLEREGITLEFVKIAKNKLDVDYLTPLLTAHSLLQDVSPEKSLLQNTEALVGAVDYLTFLPKEIFSKLSTDLYNAYTYAQVIQGHLPFETQSLTGNPPHLTSLPKIKPPLQFPNYLNLEILKKPYFKKDTLLPSTDKENFEHGLRILYVIGNIWLDLSPKFTKNEKGQEVQITPDKREAYIGKASRALYQNLLGQSEPFLLWISGRLSSAGYDGRCGGSGCSKEYYMNETTRSKYVDRLGTSCHARIKTEVERWISESDYRRNLKIRDPKLYAVFTSFQDQILKSVILKRWTASYEEVEEDGKKIQVPIQQEFSVPYASKNKGIIQSFVKKLVPICLDDVQEKIETTLNNYVLVSLDSEIRKYAEKIENIVKDKIILSHEDLVRAVQSPQLFKEYFEKMAAPLVKDLLFENSPTRNGLERSKVSLFITNGVWNTVAQEDLFFETGAKTLGTSLSANYYRLITLPEARNVNPVSKDYYVAVFEQINKMLSMIGFRRMDKTQQKSLFRRFYNGPIQELDVYKYDCNKDKLSNQNRKRQIFAETKNFENFVDWREYCERYEDADKSYFNLPDQLAIQDAFEPVDGVFESTAKASSEGQSEVIRGASLMLKYFKDWKDSESEGEDDYDVGMGKLMFSNVFVFPKHAFVNLTVATATVSVRGLKKPDSGLFLFNADGIEFKDWQKEGMPPQNSPNPVALAAVADILTHGPVRILKTSDLARFIIAIDEFLIATENIYKTKATVINPPNKKEKDNLKNLLEGRRLLKLMMAGVSNFLTSRFQDSDGGFWHTYDLNRSPSSGDGPGSLINKETIPRSLEDQMLVIEALFRTHRQWKGTGAMLAAVDTYHFINNKLFNTQTGFYNSREGMPLAIKPHQYLELIQTLNRIKEFPINASSKQQAVELSAFYEQKWLQWINTQHLQTVP